MENSICMIGIQLGTLLTTVFLFKRIYTTQEADLAACLGIILYMTCPYRIYVCYDLVSLSQAVAWMLLPLYAGAVIGIVQQKKKIGNMMFAAIALAGIGYANVIYFLIVVGITLLTGMLLRKLWTWVPAVMGSILLLPILYRLLQYLFLDYYQELNLPIQSIMKNGYRFGEFFSSYAYKEGHPGMGIGMLVCLLAGMWLNFVHGRKEKSGLFKYFVVLSFLCMLLSFYYFPWDIVQRMGSWSLKLVSLIGTPGIFAGLAFGSLCVPASYGIYQISKHENRMIAAGIPVLAAIACIGLCIYQCIH